MKRGEVDEREDGGDRRVVALGVADGERRARLRRRGDHLVGFGHRARHRLLDQHRHAALEERQRDVAVQLGRHGDGHGIDFADERRDVGQRPGCLSTAAISAARSGSLSTTAVSVDALERRENARVMAAEMADADDGDAQSAIRRSRRP